MIDCLSISRRTNKLFIWLPLICVALVEVVVLFTSAKETTVESCALPRAEWTVEPRILLEVEEMIEPCVWLEVEGMVEPCILLEVEGMVEPCVLLEVEGMVEPRILLEVEGIVEPSVLIVPDDVWLYVTGSVLESEFIASEVGENNRMFVLTAGEEASGVKIVDGGV